MTRRIQFRAKAIVNQKWNGIKVGDFVHGSFIESGVDATCIVFGDGEQVEIDISTMGQLTGFKSVRGVNVFEGDNLTLNGEDVGFVRFEDGAFQLTDGSKQGRNCLLQDRVKRFDINGTIHD